jgi:hypothetical protein
MILQLVNSFHLLAYFTKTFILLSCFSSLSRAGSRRCIVVTASAFQGSPLVTLQNCHRSYNRKSSSATEAEAACLSNVKLFSTSTMVEKPPLPRREEDRVVYAGSAPEGWDSKIPRQANDSTETLITPPVPVSDPYGWMRDDKRESREVLDYLNAENEYSKSVIQHLGVRKMTISCIGLGNNLQDVSFVLYCPIQKGVAR